MLIQIQLRSELNPAGTITTFDPNMSVGSLLVVLRAPDKHKKYGVEAEPKHYPSLLLHVPSQNGETTLEPLPEGTMSKGDGVLVHTYELRPPGDEPVEYTVDFARYRDAHTKLKVLPDSLQVISGRYACIHYLPGVPKTIGKPPPPPPKALSDDAVVEFLSQLD
jgi:hypothetical protein